MYSLNNLILCIHCMTLQKHITSYIFHLVKYNNLIIHWNEHILSKFLFLIIFCVLWFEMFFMLYLIIIIDLLCFAVIILGLKSTWLIILGGTMVAIIPIFTVHPLVISCMYLFLKKSCSLKSLKAVMINKWRDKRLYVI